MATQRYISTSFWDDEWIQTLEPLEKFLYLYLMTNSLTNIAGVYKITIRRICFDTGLNTSTIEQILSKFQKAGKAFLYEEYMILPSWPQHQKAEERSKIKLGIDAILKVLPIEIVNYMVSIGYRYHIEGYAYPSNYSDIDSDSDSDIDSDIDSDSEGGTEPSLNGKKAKKQPFGKEGAVLLTDKEYSDLVGKYGEEQTARLIEALADYKLAHGKKYKSDAAAIRSWVIDRVKPRPLSAPSASNTLPLASKDMPCPKCKTIIPAGEIACPSCDYLVADILKGASH